MYQKQVLHIYVQFCIVDQSTDVVCLYGLHYLRVFMYNISQHLIIPLSFEAYSIIQDPSLPNHIYPDHCLQGWGHHMFKADFNLLLMALLSISM